MRLPFPFYDAHNKELKDIISRLLDMFFVIFITIGFIPIVGSLARVYQYGWKIQNFVHIGGYLFFLFVYVTKKRYSFRTIIYFLVLFMTIIGFFNLATYGITSMGITILLFMLVIATIFIGPRESILIAVFLLLGLTALATAVCNRWLPMAFDANAYITSWTVWINQISLFIIIAVVIITLITGILSPLLNTLKNLRDRTHEVFDTNRLLFDSEAKTRTIIETAPEAILTADLEGNITSCNKAALDLFNAPEESDILGRSAFELIIDEERQRAIADMERLKINHLLRSAEYTIIDPKGITKSVMLSAAILKNNDGTPYGLLAMLQDVSHTKEMEERLRQSEKMEAVGQLAGGIAHDFNNQLAGIVGYADLLREELSNNPDLAHYADNILLGAKHASDLTSQLLAFSRKGKYLSIPVDLHKIIGEVVTILQRTIDRRIIIRQQFNAQAPVTSGDPTQVQNAVLNVALNSRDAMPDGGELVFSTSEAHLDDEFCSSSTFEIHPGTYQLLCITDNGTGMDEETQKRVFEPFFTTKEPGKGTGMGMASVYGTVKNHGGAIGIYSEPGRGTSIKLYFPSYKSEQAVEKEKNIAIRPADTNAHILLVDDEDLVVNTATRMLEKTGYKVTVCRNGGEAVKFYTDNWRDIDLIILDLIMPEASGRDTFSIMKRINPRLIVLVSSGYSINSEAQKIIDDGAKGFIQKPYRRTELCQLIEDTLKQYR